MWISKSKKYVGNLFLISWEYKKSGLSIFSPFSNEEWDQMQAQEEDVAITEQDLELIKERETAIRQLEVSSW